MVKIWGMTMVVLDVDEDGKVTMLADEEDDGDQPVPKRLTAVAGFGTLEYHSIQEDRDWAGFGTLEYHSTFC